MSYLKKNEGLWILHNDKDYCMGLTAEMADTLGEVTFISLPKVGQSVKAGEPLLEIEAEKAALAHREEELQETRKQKQFLEEELERMRQRKVVRMADKVQHVIKRSK